MKLWFHIKFFWSSSVVSKTKDHIRIFTFVFSGTLTLISIYQRSPLLCICISLYVSKLVINDFCRRIRRCLQCKNTSITKWLTYLNVYISCSSRISFLTKIGTDLILCVEKYSNNAQNIIFFDTKLPSLI